MEQSGDVQEGKSKKRRARVACVLCRTRKVRCDVAYTGAPCTNCVLDGTECIVNTRRKQKDSLRPRTFVTISPRNQLEDDAGPITPETIRNPRDGTNSGRMEYSEGENSLPGNDAVSNPSPDSIFQSGPIRRDHSPRLASFGADVPYSSFPFLTLDNIARLTPIEINFLEMQGCFRVPNRLYLQEFVRHYFLHVHPLLPILKESSFFTMFESGQPTNKAEGKLSLFILQGILFVSCGFVQPEIIHALGFDDIRSAKATFYRRAKMLVDHDALCDAVEIAQGALLLTYWGKVDDGIRRNTSWLSLAIQNAQSAGAHWKASADARFGTRRRLRRLWWCCLIRDRLMSLGLHRPILLTRDHLGSDNENEQSMTHGLAANMMFERVYGAKHKDVFGAAFISLCNLCLALTDVLLLVHPLHESMQRLQQPSSMSQVASCHRQLDRWYAMSYSPIIAELTSSEPNEVHTTVSLLSIYYHAAKISLYQLEIIQSNTIAMDFTNLPAATSGMQKAAEAIASCSEEIFNRGQAIYLPSTAPACTAIPLLLAVLDARLAKRRPITPEGNSPIARLDRLIKIMDVYRCQYEGVDTISEAIRRVLTLGSLPAVGDWMELVATHPKVYLKFVIFLEKTLSKGRYLEVSEVLYDSSGPLPLPQPRSTDTTSTHEANMPLAVNSPHDVLDEFVSIPDVSDQDEFGFDTWSVPYFEIDMLPMAN